VFSFKNEEHRIMIEFAYGFLLARRTLVLAAVLVASCGAIWAQADGQASPPTNGPAPGEMHRRGPGVERELAQLTHVLSLSAEQQTQVKALLTAQRQQFEALRNPSAANGSSNEAAPPTQRSPLCSTTTRRPNSPRGSSSANRGWSGAVARIASPITRELRIPTRRVNNTRRP
jgi:hypothetical protein